MPKTTLLDMVLASKSRCSPLCAAPCALWLPPGRHGVLPARTLAPGRVYHRQWYRACALLLRHVGCTSLKPVL